MEKNILGQYFTPRHIADLMVGLLEANFDDSILEPSCGEGVFLDSLFDAGYSNLFAVEIDNHLNQRTLAKVAHTSFVSWNPGRKFSAVIGNPPYIRWKNLGEDQKAEIQQSPHWGKLFNSLSDYLMVFIVNAIDLLEDDGELIFITPSFWLHTQHAENVRNFMVERGVFTSIIAFGEAKVFEGVSSSILIFRYLKTSKKNRDIEFYDYSGPRKVPSEIFLLPTSEFFTCETIPQFVSGSHWTLAPEKKQNEIKKLENWAGKLSVDTLFHDEKYSRIGEYFDIANGMVSGLDKAFRVTDELLQLANSNERLAFSAVVKGADLSRLVCLKTSSYIDLPLGMDEGTLREKYPNIYNHLLNFRTELEKRYDYGRDLPFWEWSFRRSEKFFLNGNRKVFVPCKERITNKTNIRFAIGPLGSIATQDVTALAPMTETRESVEYLAAYLTLDEVTNWIRIRGLVKGGIAEFSERPLASIPFRSINWESEGEKNLHDEITQLVRMTEAGGNREKSFELIREKFLLLGLPESKN